MGPLSCDKKTLLEVSIVLLTSLCAIIGTIFSLTHDILSVYPFLYILPIICVVWFWPRRAVLFALAISIVYIAFVYLLGEFDPVLVAVSTAWFAIFITIAVVSSSYANGLIEKKSRIRHILENTRDGTFCFNPVTLRIKSTNQKCAQWLLYSEKELEDRPVNIIWTDTEAQRRFLDDVKSQKTGAESKVVFRQKNGGMLHCIITPLYVTNDTVLCSVVNVMEVTADDEQIRETLEDLERQVRERTAHLEKLNDDLRAEIRERRTLEQALLSKEREDESRNTKAKRP
ncbi:MAG TPA: hypothetical protein PKM50_01220 [Methanoregula sp.]|nr:hypothetical protein [Methanoregula sp.]